MNIEMKETTKALAVGSLLSILMLTARIIFTGEITFIFLIWNLFLAWIPLYFSIKLVKTTTENKSGIKALAFCMCWLFFFPNAPYLITDLIHLKPRIGVPYWFDILLITSFVWNGLLLCFASLIKVHHVIAKKWGTRQGWVFVIISLILSGYGIYLGRFLRWNTWDILLNPINLIHDIIAGFINPEYLFRMWGVTLGFAMFLISGYMTLLAFLNKTKN
jgi:uncharacterized membrane protein